MSATANETGLSPFNSIPKGPIKCVVCGNTHGLWACDAFKRLAPIDRYKKVKENKLCFLCFRGGHAVKDCKIKECGIDGCKRRHNRLLHRPEETNNSNTTSTEIVETHASVSLNTFGILPVYKVELSNNGNRVKLLALVDSGSSLSWIDKTSADQLNLQGVKRSLTVSGINGTECHENEIVNVTIHSKDYGDEDIQMACHQKLVIGESFYDIRKMQSQYPQLTKVPSNNFNLKDVKVILGTDCFSLTRLLEYQRGQSGEPWVVRCSLGWAVSGSLPRKIVSSLTSCHSSVYQSANFDLNEQIKTWWDNESYGSRVKVDGRSRSDVKALETLKKTTHCENDRYTVGMLWNSPRSRLPNNYRSAVKQFLSLETRLAKNPELKDAYSDTIKTDKDSGYIRILEPTELQETKNEPQCDLPHHPVINPNKPGKVRRVCNAASEFEGYSLNKSLFIVPDLLQNLVGVIFRFQEKPFGMSADIEAMFLQVQVPTEDAKCLRFIWRENQSDDLSTDEYTRYIWSQRLANMCKLCFATYRHRH